MSLSAHIPMMRHIIFINELWLSEFSLSIIRPGPACGLHTPLSPSSAILHSSSSIILEDFSFINIFYIAAVRMSWQLPTFYVWSYAFTFSSGGLIVTLLLHVRLHSVSLNDLNDKSNKRAFKARSITGQCRCAKLDGSIGEGENRWRSQILEEDACRQVRR